MLLYSIDRIRGEPTLHWTGVSDSRGEAGGWGRACSVFSLNIDFSFLMLCVGANPLSLVKLKKKTIVRQNGGKCKILFL